MEASCGQSPSVWLVVHGGSLCLLRLVVAFARFRLLLSRSGRHFSDAASRRRISARVLVSSMMLRPAAAGHGSGHRRLASGPEAALHDLLEAGRCSVASGVRCDGASVAVVVGVPVASLEALLPDVSAETVKH